MRRRASPSARKCEPRRLAVQGALWTASLKARFVWGSLLDAAPEPILAFAAALNADGTHDLIQNINMSRIYRYSALTYPEKLMQRSNLLIVFLAALEGAAGVALSAAAAHISSAANLDTASRFLMIHAAAALGPRRAAGGEAAAVALAHAA